ncbi:helix-turn-helix domain-containing protein [Sphingomonas sp. RS2018]
MAQSPKPAGDRKLYLGPRLRMLRRELGLNQAQMADELGVSPSYLNHLERNQRPLTAQMLLRLAQTYDLDVRSFVAGASEATATDLHEIFADALVHDIGVPRQEILEVAENYPGVAEGLRRLYRAIGDLRQVPDRIESAGSGGARLASPLAWLRDWLEAKRNHFADIDAAAEELSASLGTGPEALREGMVRHLADEHHISVRVVAADVLAGGLRHYDYHRRRLMLSERLNPASRAFGIAVQLALVALAEPIGAALDAAAPPDAEARRLAHQALANHAAAALLMPYAAFHAAAVQSRYDMELLCDRFGVSYEQAAHRLTTLDRPSARGVPLFLLKIDAAGNVAKRYAPDQLPLARYGGGCPRWRVHRAASHPGETVVDRAEMPDGSRYFSWSRTVPSRSGGAPMTLVLGCAASAADAIGLSAAVSEVTPIGPACHLCERPACPDRALPPITRALAIDPHHRGVAPYPFRAV